MPVETMRMKANYLYVLSRVIKIYFYCVTHAWDSGGPGAFACNIAIFFDKLVTCTHYGATYWDNVQGTVYFPGGSTPIVPTKSPVVNKIIYYLTIYLYIPIIKVTNTQ